MNQPVNAAKQDKLKTINWLIEHFPAAFFKTSALVKPLKIGIFEDIIDFYERLDSPPFSKKRLRDSLNYYSASPAYLLAQQPQAPRIDLFGEAVDNVTEEQAAYAVQRYQQHYAKDKCKT